MARAKRPKGQGVQGPSILKLDFLLNCLHHIWLLQAISISELSPSILCFSLQPDLQGMMFGFCLSLSLFLLRLYPAFLHTYFMLFYEFDWRLCLGCLLTQPSRTFGHVPMPLLLDVICGSFCRCLRRGCQAQRKSRHCTVVVHEMFMMFVF